MRICVLYTDAPWLNSRVLPFSVRPTYILSVDMLLLIWLPDYFTDLINRINNQKKFTTILLFGPGDLDLGKTITEMINTQIPTFISDDLRKFMALQSLCKVFICNNSGPLHLAVAQKIQTISFMGPTEKARWMPVGSNHKVLRIDSLPCIGCKQGICRIKTHDCMRLISPSTVIDALMQCYP